MRFGILGSGSWATALAKILCEQNEKLKTSLMLAVLGGHVSIVKVLLEHGHANTEIKEASGRTSLYLAASIGKLDIVDLLLKYG